MPLVLGETAYNFEVLDEDAEFTDRIKSSPPAFSRQRQLNLYEFQASLEFIANSKPARLT